jgi:hypothetical protein
MDEEVMCRSVGSMFYVKPQLTRDLAILHVTCPRQLLLTSERSCSLNLKQFNTPLLEIRDRTRGLLFFPCIEVIRSEARS